jgi:hypothetical protein
MPPVRFEPTIPASARPQTHALDRAATGIGLAVHVPSQSLDLTKPLACDFVYIPKQIYNQGFIITP